MKLGISTMRPATDNRAVLTGLAKIRTGAPFRYLALRRSRSAANNQSRAMALSMDLVAPIPGNLTEFWGRERS